MVLCSECGCVLEQKIIFAQSFEERCGGGGGKQQFFCSVSQTKLNFEAAQKHFKMLLQQAQIQQMQRSIETFESICRQINQGHSSFDQVRFAEFIFNLITHKNFDPSEYRPLMKFIKNFEQKIDSIVPKFEFDFTTQQIQQQAFNVAQAAKVELSPEQKADIGRLCNEIYHQNQPIFVNCKREVVIASCINFALTKAFKFKIPFKHFNAEFKVSQVTISGKVKAMTFTPASQA